MPSRAVLPFPFPLSIGTDICHIPRIHRILQHSERRRLQFVRRVLNATETARPHLREPIAWILDGRVPAKEGRRLGAAAEKDGGAGGASDLWRAACFMAGRFAAKEAVIKAHHEHKLTFHDITILSRRTAAAATTRERNRQTEDYDDSSDETGRRSAAEEEERGSGPPVATVMLAGEAHEVAVSISHDGDYATAVCLGVRV
ncbi:hypothetical protein NKR23_g9841 [Pleurostoma richardsiae]|uniref:4'-phosphopantetheinyl transferase domain-containing protein n=1 Tax=Pleurostoma richardsiae TaxID=41990 RepID=A0AA38VJ29_9PEZI|nr:hypothetical protein NKR23_g9841 [Pleurostoma richardsiae]